MPRSKFYAIGLKGWVQIRECTKEPTRLETVALIPTKEERTVWNAKSLFYEYKTVTVKRKLKAVVYEGGKEILTIAHAKFSRRLKLTVPEHTCIKLTAAQVTALKGKQNVKARDHV